jgi:hypothetical protein
MRGSRASRESRGDKQWSGSFGSLVEAVKPAARTKAIQCCGKTLKGRLFVPVDPAYVNIDLADEILVAISRQSVKATNQVDCWNTIEFTGWQGRRKREEKRERRGQERSNKWERAQGGKKSGNRKRKEARMEGSEKEGKKGKEQTKEKLRRAGGGRERDKNSGRKRGQRSLRQAKQ